MSSKRVNATAVVSTATHQGIAMTASGARGRDTETAPTRQPTEGTELHLCVCVSVGVRLDTRDSTYVGQWSNDRKHGKGVMTLAAEDNKGAPYGVFYCVLPSVRRALSGISSALRTASLPFPPSHPRQRLTTVATTASGGTGTATAKALTCPPMATGTWDSGSAASRRARAPSSATTAPSATLRTISTQTPSLLHARCHT